MSLLLDALKEASNHHKKEAESIDKGQLPETPEGELELELNLDEIDLPLIDSGLDDEGIEAKTASKVNINIDKEKEMPSNYSVSEKADNIKAQIPDTKIQASAEAVKQHKENVSVNHNEQTAQAIFRNRAIKRKISTRFVMIVVFLFVMTGLVGGYYYKTINKIGSAVNSAIPTAIENISDEMEPVVGVKTLSKNTQPNNYNESNNTKIVKVGNPVTDISSNQEENAEKNNRISVPISGTKSIQTRAEVVTTPALSISKTKASSNKQSNVISIRKRRIPNSVRRQLTLAKKAMGSGEWQNASKHFRAVLDETPESFDALIGLADVMIALGENDISRSLYLQSLEKAPGNIKAQLGILNLENNKTTLSHGSKLKQLLSKNSKLDYLHASLGDYHIAREEWSSAQVAYFEALRLSPMNPNYAFNLAVCLDQLGKEKIAMGYYTKAIEFSKSGVSRFDKQAVKERLKELNGGVL